MTYIHNMLFAFTVLSVFTLQSCKDDSTETALPGLGYTIPASYSTLANVNFDGQTQRLNQFLELKNYMKTANVSGVVLNENRLLAMFENNSAAADWAGTYQDSKQIKNKTLAAVQDDFTSLLNSLVASSKSTTAHSEGTAGVISSSDNAKSYLLNENGVDEAQIFEKSLMGAFIAYQINEVYTAPGKMDVDNIAVTEGKGTAMEHHWDEAFGYFGVPTTFPETKDNLLFWGSYSEKRDALLSTNDEIMTAYLSGRAAITNKDLVNRDANIIKLRSALEKVSASSAIHYLNSSIANFDDWALKGHALAEAVGFIYALQFNGDKKISTDEVNELLVLIGGSASLTDLNFYGVTITDIESATTQLSALYGLDSVKDAL